MKLCDLSPPKGSKKNRKKVGRGVGSGFGKTAGRGSKGQNSRSGGGVRPGFEGGQMPIHRRLPKRGFKNIFKKRYSIINIRDIAGFKPESIVSEVELISAGLISGKRDGIKLLGQGEINIPLVVKVDKASQNAVKKVEAAGGRIEAV